MKKATLVAVTAIGTVALLALTGYAFANAPKPGTMVGIIASKKSASVEVMDQPGAKGSIKVAKVQVPGPSWIAVHLDDKGMPGKRVGLQSVPAGNSTDVEVKLDGVKLTDKLIVAVHADRGIVGKFEFDKKLFDASPDKPYFVGGMELAMETKVSERPFGVKAADGEASIKISDQPVVAGAIIVDEAVAPAGAWVVVHLDEGGKPGKRVGYQQIFAGTNQRVAVMLDPSITLTDRLLVAVHADRGVAGKLEFDMMDKYASPDQPFFVGGKEVATAVTIK